MTRNDRTSSLLRALLGAHHERRQTWSLRTWVAPPLGLVLPAALLCTGCPVSSDLERPYEEYIPSQATQIATTGGGAGTPTATTAGTVTGTATTGATANCTDADIDTFFENSCAHSTCHGTETEAPTDTNLPWLLASRKMDLMVPGVECPNEYIIDPNNPAQSLLVTTLNFTAACGSKMPSPGISMLPADQIQCVQGWVNDVVAAAAGVQTDPAPAAGGGAGF